jgi:hypothetical protein
MQEIKLNSALNNSNYSAQEIKKRDPYSNTSSFSQSSKNSLNNNPKQQ